MASIPGVPEGTITTLRRYDEAARGQSSADPRFSNKGFSSAGKPRSGGGGGRSSDDVSRDQIASAEQLRIAQERDAQIRAAAILEAQKKQAEQQQARQERIQAGKISGQLEQSKVNAQQTEQTPFKVLGNGKFQGVVSLPPQDKFYKAQSFFRGKGEAVRVAGEFAKPFINLGEFGYSLVTKPVQTTVATGTGLYQTGKKVVTGQGFPEVGEFARTDPFGFTARVGGELVLSKGIQAVLVRTPSAISATATRLDPTAAKVIERPLAGTPFTESLITNVKKVKEIGLIPEKDPLIGKSIPKGIEKTELPATVRGGFGIKRAEQKRFSGVKGLATSQRGLFGMFKKEVPILESEPGLGLFATPADPITGRLQTRVSRLGEAPRSAGLKDILEGSVSFKGTPKPQIIVFPEERFGSGSFKAFPKSPSSELEGATKPGGVLRIKEKLGKTVIGKGIGRKVDIYEGEIVQDARLSRIQKDIFAGKKVSKADKFFYEKQTGLKSQFIESKAVVSKTGLITSFTPKRTAEIKKDYRYTPNYRSRLYSLSRETTGKGSVAPKIPGRVGGYSRQTQIISRPGLPTPVFPPLYDRPRKKGKFIRPGLTKKSNLRFQRSKSSSKILGQRTKYIPSLVGTVRYNVLGRQATASRRDVMAASGLPLIRPVISM